MLRNAIIVSALAASFGTAAHARVGSIDCDYLNDVANAYSAVYAQADNRMLRKIYRHRLIVLHAMGKRGRCSIDYHPGNVSPSARDDFKPGFQRTRGIFGKWRTR